MLWVFVADLYDIKQIQKALTFKTNDKYTNQRKTSQFYINRQQQIAVPFMYLRKHYPLLFNSALPNPIPLSQTFRYNGKLYATTKQPQQKVCATTLRHLSHYGGTIMVLPCGTGKTNVAIAVALKMGLRTMILCHTSELMVQWKHRLECFVTPVPSIGKIQQNVCETNCDFVIASLQSLHSRQYEDIDTSLIIVDEVHHIAAVTFSRVLANIRHRYILGLTATLHRKDNLEMAIYQLIGLPCVIPHDNTRGIYPTTKLPQLLIQIPKRQDVQVNRIMYGRSVPFRTRQHWSAPQLYMQLLHQLCEDKSRNELICTLVSKIHKPHRQGLILSARIKHLKQLYNMLVELKIPCEIYTGSIQTEKQPKHTAKVFTTFVTLSTYHKFGEAIDYPGNFVILSTPCGAVEQSTGRILRGRHQKVCPAIIDICDQDHPIFRNMGWKRHKFYRQRGYEIIDLNCHVST